MSSVSRSTKRKRYSNIKNMLVNDLHNLTIDSGEFNNELIGANDDFVLMFKSMEDRQNQYMSSFLVIEEKYREINAILKEGKQAKVGGGSSENVEFPLAYQSNLRKFIADSSTSLSGHSKSFIEQVEEMVKVFNTYGDVLKEKLTNLKARAEVIAEERAKLAVKLSDFLHNL